MNVAAESLSRARIRKITEKLRELIGCSEKAYFPIVEFIEWIMGDPENDFDYEIVEAQEMQDMYGNMNTGLNVMKIREDVYIGAINGKIEKPTLYSSAEKQIGVTDSGEPIYRKTIYANMGSFKIPSSGYQQADIGTGVVIGKLFNISCHIIGFKNYALPYCGNGTAWGTWLNTVEKVGTQHVLRFYNNVNWGSGYTLVATIDYTK